MFHSSERRENQMNLKSIFQGMLVLFLFFHFNKFDMYGFVVKNLFVWSWSNMII